MPLDEETVHERPEFMLVMLTQLLWTLEFELIAISEGSWSLSFPFCGIWSWVVNENVNTDCMYVYVVSVVTVAEKKDAGVTENSFVVIVIESTRYSVPETTS